MQSQSARLEAQFRFLHPPYLRSVMPLGLYIHIPFCSSICGYCNFNRILFDAKLRDRYLRALELEIRATAALVNAGLHPVTRRPLAGEWRGRPARADTLYLGGGTPSLLSPSEIGSLVDTCRSCFALADEAEITLEANPETVTAGTLAGCREAGVNRISLGVQSFRDEELRRLGRIHDAARARAAFDSARAAGFDNISLDLMLWLPQQTVGQCLESVRALVGLGPEHASLYLMELYPNAPLREGMARAGWSLAPEDDAADMYLRAVGALAAAGYEHYEISNFARPGRMSRHNLKYWSDGEWLAFGCSAHSTTDGVRWKNVSATESYLRRVEDATSPAAAELRELGPQERFEEAAFMGLRLTRGIDLESFRRTYGVDVWRTYGGRLQPFVEAGLLVREGSRLRLSTEGLLVSNDVMAVFIGHAGTVK
jgi:oxygen-independent coproporphyrinogen-3 oxidase